MFASRHAGNRCNFPSALLVGCGSSWPQPFAPSPAVATAASLSSVTTTMLPALESDPVAFLPIAQLLVGAFSRHADHLADLALGHADLPAFGEDLAGLCQLDQNPGEPGRKVQEHHPLHLLVGPAQPFAENIDELEGDLRMIVHERH